MARKVFAKGCVCPFLKCSSIGLPSDIYLHLMCYYYKFVHFSISLQLTNFKLKRQGYQQTMPMLPTSSLFTESLTMASSTLSDDIELTTPFLQLSAELPNKKRRLKPPPSPTPYTTLSHSNVHSH